MKNRVIFVAVCISLLGLQRGQPSSPFAATNVRAQASAADRERAYRVNNTGVAFLEQFNYADAEKSFREALKIDTTLALARLNLAIALLYAGRPAEAVTEAATAAKQLPDAPQPPFVVGLAAKADNQIEEATAAFERVLKINPADAGTKIHLGQIHLQQRRFPEALSLFQEALASEPYNVTAAYNVALALTRSGQAEEGRAAMQRFEQLRDSAYGVTYAQTYLAQGRYGEAIASSGAEADLVDAAIPAVTFSRVPLPDTARRPTRRLTLFDSDADGDLDLFMILEDGTRLLRNEKGTFTDVTTAAGIGLPGDWVGAIAGDYDNDTKPDLLILGQKGHRLVHQKADGGFEIVKVALPPPVAGLTSGVFVDADHDGDVDILTAGDSVQLLQNNGAGVFADITDKSGLGAVTRVGAIAATDYDNRRDVDFFFMTATGPILYRNMRDGSFRDWSKEAGLASAATLSTSLGVGDVNKDGYPDLVYGSKDATSLALSDGQGRFRVTDGPLGSGSSQLFDYDNDGLLDVIIASSSAVRLARNLGQGKWADVTDHARVSTAVPAGGFAIGDLDSDGDADVLVRTDGSLGYLRNDGGNKNASLPVRLAARVSNRSGVGAKVEMRAGSLRQMLETSSSSPAVAPADLLFGLGSRTAADVVRVLWPSGILQAETSSATSAERPAPGSSTPNAQRPAPMTIQELDRKPSSCPYLFTWNGARFEFVTDFMGGGEMGAWLAPATWNQPDPDEYVRIRSDQLVPRNGRYELRLTNELEEALFVDRLQLVAVDHADDVDVYPNEGLKSTRPPFAMTAVRRAQVPARVVDGHGHDVTPRIASIDRRYPDDFGLLPVRGYAEPHELIIDLGTRSDANTLLLTGWTDYAFSNDNVAASQRGTAMKPPSLQIRGRDGRWRTAIEEIGFPVGRPQTVVVDLRGKLPPGSHDVRIVTNMRIYWDRILVGQAVGSTAATMTRLEPRVADLRERGFSEEITPDGREPFSYDYSRVSTAQPWKVMVGRYTRVGDVRPLVTRTDDLFVVSKPGDEVALSFAALPPVASGRTRTFLLYVHGYSKEMNPRSALPESVEPLPFRAMSGYPYRADEHYPRTPAHRDYRARYNTRIVTRPLPSIDVAASAFRLKAEATK